ncbi:MAG: hypothetical protein P9X26_01005, partial [Candidatus Stygibacter frigidus]|nr:hypothetical protein [Candidatus Stygibacter frigidus]
NINNIPYLPADTLHTRISVIENVYYNGLAIPNGLELVEYTLNYDGDVEVVTGAALEVCSYNNGTWVKINDVNFNGSTADFKLPAGDNILAVFLNEEGVLNLEIGTIAIDPSYDNYANATPDFVVPVLYEGVRNDLMINVILDDLFIIENNIPFSGDIISTWTATSIDPLNDLLNVKIVDGGNYLLDAETEHTVQIILTDIYGNETSTEALTFNIDDTPPAITEIPYDDGLTFSAIVIDELTMVENVEMTMIINVTSFVFNELTNDGDTYSYTFGYTELMGLLGANVGNFDVKWNVTDAVGNNCEYQYTYEYDLTLCIAFDPFEGGYWFNPTMLNEFTFEVLTPAGVNIAHNGVTVNFSTAPGNVPQYSTPAEYNELDGKYHVNYAGIYPPDASALILEADITTTSNDNITKQQSYGIDYVAPVVWVLSPIGDPIDNDNDGLYNEDPIDGVNNDGDWIDYNGNGIPDWYVDPLNPLNPPIQEPGIIDEDPVDFYPAELDFGTDIVISIRYEDIPMFHGGYYSAASGIDEENINLMINGVAVSPLNITNGILTYTPGEIMEPGHYVVTAIIPDNAGNVGTFSSYQFAFDIIAPAPTITFFPLQYEGQTTWVFNPGANSDNVFNFDINWNGNSEIAQNVVTVCFYEQPGEVLLQGPSVIQATGIEGNTASYAITFGSNVMDELAPGIIIEVEAQNIWGACTSNRQTYQIQQSSELAFMPTVGTGKIHFSDNPLTDESHVDFKVTRNADVYVTIYDFSGRKVKELSQRSNCLTGIGYSISWDGTNGDGDKVARGGYIAHFEARESNNNTVRASEWIKIAVTK